MLTRENIIYCVTSILLIAYLAVTFVLCNNSAAAATAPADSPVIIAITGGDTNRFVTSDEISRIVAPLIAPEAGRPIRPAAVNTLAVGQALNDVDNIEWARCSRTGADRLLIEVVPMKPVARVFDGDSSYYINRRGKRLTASLRFRSDVPVILGHPADTEQLLSLIPLIDTIAARPDLTQLVTSIRLAPGGDVILTPSIRGHVVNFGAPDRDIANKFDRLLTMYRSVLPVKGWDFYDTLSVKFARQVVATRRSPAKRAPLLVHDPEGDAAEERALAGLVDSKPSEYSEPSESSESSNNPEPSEPFIFIEQ